MRGHAARSRQARAAICETVCFAPRKQTVSQLLSSHREKEARCSGVGGSSLNRGEVCSPSTRAHTPHRTTNPAGLGGSSLWIWKFANTEEKYRVKILGCRRRGRPREKFDHTKGYVRERRGDYYDALVVKKGRVIPMIVEVLPHHSPRACAHRAPRSTRQGQEVA